MLKDYLGNKKLPETDVMFSNPSSNKDYIGRYKDEIKYITISKLVVAPVKKDPEYEGIRWVEKEGRYILQYYSKLKNKWQDVGIEL